MAIDFYVRSAGANEEQDYAWVKVPQQPEEAQMPKKPPFLSDEKVDKLIYRECFSLLLGRFGERIVLQVTGILATTRCDSRNRVIRNSIGCIGELDDELVLRGIAVAALEGKALEDLVDKAVDFDESVAEGFSVSSTLPDSLRRQEGLVEQGSEQGKIIPKGVGKNCDELKKYIADELKKGRLPQGDGPHIVVTSHVPEEVFRDEKVYLGLSSLIGSTKLREIEQSSSPIKDGTTLINRIEDTCKRWLGGGKDQRNFNRTAAFVVVVVVIATVVYFLSKIVYILESYGWQKWWP
jgi:hypothetical protein